MPLIGEFHTFYWEISDTAVAPVKAAITGGYPLWQSSVILGVGLGGASELVSRGWDALRWFLRLVRRSYRYDRVRRAVVLKTLDALEHPGFPLAQASVKKTATTLGFNRPEAWKELSRELKGNAGTAENAFRHLEACRLLRANLLESTLTNPQAHLMIELAYQGFTVKAR